MEILAPAGSPSGFIAAVEGGCDAVYLAGKSFGARAFAGNFSDAELEGAVEYAHRHNVKVNVTVNTLIKNSEMSEAVSFVQFLSDIGADAVIIQDLGLLKEIRNIPIAKHASTQMGIHSKEGLKWCSENGISRAILSRELSLDEIEELCKDSPIEIEVFVHGAMCYCFSGGCLMSSIIGGRSGNRGKCAQPCRKRYAIGDESGYFLSNKDMFCIDYIEKLKKMGVASVKIEGRMRGDAYVYLASKAYSMANRGESGKELDETIELLNTVFNRGFCKGYLDGAESLVQSRFPDNRGLPLGKVTIKKRNFQKGNLPINAGDGLTFFSGNTKVGGFTVEGDGETIRSPFAIKDGEYDVYRTFDPRIDVISKSFADIPKLNGNTKRKTVTVRSKQYPRNKTKPTLSFYVSSTKVLKAIISFADRIYYDGTEIEKARAICEERGKEFIYYMPRICPSDSIPEGDFGIMVHTPGQYRAVHSTGRKVYGSCFMNRFNSFDGIDTDQSTLSVELTKNEISDLLSTSKKKAEVIVFGRLELMVTRDRKLGSGVLKDEKEYEFPFYQDKLGYSHIMNSSDTMLLSQYDDLCRMGIDSLGIDLRKRPVELAMKVGLAFRDRDVSLTDTIKTMCGGTFNTGHFTRGV